MPPYNLAHVGRVPLDRWIFVSQVSPVVYYFHLCIAFSRCANVARLTLTLRYAASLIRLPAGEST